MSQMTENKLTSRQRKALAALLSETTVTAAAAKAGLNPRTLYRYLQQEAFQRAFTQVQTDAMDRAAARLVGGASDALVVLHHVMVNPDPAQSRMAADAWLRHTLKLYEIQQLDKRLTELEREVNHV
jgi:hypothetical protein